MPWAGRMPVLLGLLWIVLVCLLGINWRRRKWLRKNCRDFSGSGDAAVAEGDSAVGGGGEGFVVGDDDDGQTVAIQLVKEVEDSLAGAAVQVAGGFVGEE